MSSKKAHVLRLLLAGWVCLTSAACQGLPWSAAPADCSRIKEDHLSAMPVDSPSVPAIKDWVKSTYSISDTAVSLVTQSDGSDEIDWNQAGRTYNAFRTGNDIRRVRVYWNQPRPHLSAVLECLGKPESYQAGYFLAPVASLAVYLWYPAQGLVVSGGYYGALKGVKGDLEMSALTFVRPRTTQEILPLIHPSPGSWPPFTDMKSLKPWPGKPEDMVVEVDPKLK